MPIHETSTRQEKDDFFASNPPNLYKYRFWDDEYHKKVLIEGELFFSSPSLFNDPYDCGLPFRPHPDSFDPIIIKEKLEEVTARHFPELTHDVDAFNEQCAKQLFLIQQNPQSWFEENWRLGPDPLHQHFGILSLTPHPNNYLMWSHYANSHKGFCVGFDTRKLVESIAGHFQKVQYSDEIPMISLEEDFTNDIFPKLLYTKSAIWQYEDEYRLSKIHNSNTAITFDPIALTDIYFGCKTPYEHQVEIIDIVRGKYPQAKFHNLSLGKDQFKLLQGDLPIL